MFQAKIYNIEKDSSINDEIDEMRHAATASIWNAGTRLLSLQFPVSTVLVTPKNTRARC